MKKWLDTLSGVPRTGEFKANGWITPTHVVSYDGVGAVAMAAFDECPQSTVGVSLERLLAFWEEGSNIKYSPKSAKLTRTGVNVTLPYHEMSAPVIRPPSNAVWLVISDEDVSALGFCLSVFDSVMDAQTRFMSIHVDKGLMTAGSGISMRAAEVTLDGQWSLINYYAEAMRKALLQGETEMCIEDKMLWLRQGDNYLALALNAACEPLPFDEITTKLKEASSPVVLKLDESIGDWIKLIAQHGWANQRIANKLVVPMNIGFADNAVTVSDRREDIVAQVPVEYIEGSAPEWSLTLNASLIKDLPGLVEVRGETLPILIDNGNQWAIVGVLQGAN